MKEERVTIEEAHKAFATGYNGKVWELLEKSERTDDENSLLLHYAHASCAHWLEVGSTVNRQRGEWMISRVNSELGFPEAALRHAVKCLELTENCPEEMADFDIAYAYEAMTRAYSIGGNREKSVQFRRKAEEASGKIADAQDREIFQGDLAGGRWI